MAYGLTPSQLNSAGPTQWRQLIRQALDDTRCATPAFLVEDLNPTAQTVTVQIAIQERIRPNSGAAQWWDVPPVVNVPIVVPRGGGYSVTLPLRKGDEGLLVFCDTCFDNWWANGQNGAPKAANATEASGSQRQLEVRRHYVHDCGFIPGMWSQKHLLVDYSATSLQIRSDDSSTVIDVSANGVSIKGALVTAADVGTPQTLMTNTFYQWYVTNVQPFLVSKGYVGPAVPVGSETTVLKGQ